MIDAPRTGRLYTALRKITASRLGIWLFSPTLHILDRATLALSMGKATLSGVLGGVSVVTVTLSAGRTGKARSVPLFGIPAGEAIIVIASNWGRPHNPAWYRRLKASPTVAVTYRNRTAAFTGQELEGAEREVHWRHAVEVYPGYEVYQRRCPSRKIPVILLRPAPT